MFEGVRNSDTLSVITLRMREIQMKLSKGERLTEYEEKYLKLNLFGIEGERREFRDEKHRDRLLAQWWKGAKVLYKRLKEEER